MDDFEKEYAELASLYQRARASAKTNEGRQMAQRDYDEAVREIAMRQQSASRATATPARPSLTTGQRVAGTTRAVGQGVTFGFWDEAEAAARALATGRPYGEEVEKVRGSMRQFREAYPKTALASEVIGGIAVPGAGLARAAQAGVRGARTLAGSAALQGALQGAGTAEGGVGERTAGAVTGGILGGSIGYLTGQAAGAGRAMLSRKMQGGGALPEAGIPEVVRRAQEAGIADLPAALQQAASRSPETTVMDVLGTEGVRLASGIRTLGGEGGNIVEGAMRQRLETTPQRMQQAAFSTGRRAENVAQTVDDIIAQRRQAANPLYEAALGAVDEQGQRTAMPIVNESVENMLKRPLFQRAVKQAEDFAKNAGQPIQYMDVEGGRVPVRTPEFLDNVKKALDDMIYNGRRMGEGGFGPGALAQAKELRSSYVQMLDELIPGYAEARAAYAGPTALKSALEDGLEAGRKRLNPEELARDVADLADSEREFFQRGYINGLRQLIDEGRLRPSQVQTPAFAQRMDAVFGAEGQAVTEALREQVQLTGTASRILQGSPTAERLADVAELQGRPVSGDVVRTLTSPVATVLGRALDFAEARLRAPLSAARRTAVASTLMTPAAQTEALRASIRRENLARVLGQATRQRIGTATGRLAASQSVSALQSR